MIISLIVGFLLGAAAIVFALQNNDLVALTFLGWQFQTSLALLVIIALLVGALVVLLISLPSAIGDAFKVRSLRKDNQKLADALAQSRAETQAAQQPVIVQTPASPVIDIRS